MQRWAPSHHYQFWSALAARWGELSWGVLVVVFAARWYAYLHAPHEMLAARVRSLEVSSVPSGPLSVPVDPLDTLADEADRLASLAQAWVADPGPNIAVPHGLWRREKPEERAARLEAAVGPRVRRLCWDVGREGLPRPVAQTFMGPTGDAALRDLAEQLRREADRRAPTRE